ncbi:hypothetical protein D3C86_1936300 [compost metagenome]
MGDADHRRLAAGTAGTAVATQALVAVLVELVTADAVRDGRRLFRVVAFALEILVLLVGDDRRRQALADSAAGATAVRCRCVQGVVGGDCQAEHAKQ